MVALPPPRFIDIKNRAWIDRHGPDWFVPFARLMRLDRPIGTWLLLIPCWWSLALADNTGPDFWLMTAFAAGALIMRGAGCVINDIYDRNLDKQVERTKTRPLASGQMSLWAAIVFCILLLLIGLRILFLFNLPTIILGASSLILVFTYPLMKRVTWWPQFFLGLTFNWGAWLGWLAVTGHVVPLIDLLPPLLLYIAGIFWTLGYDTIYAHQDIQDDMLVGIKSTARLFGAQSRFWVGLFFFLTLAFLILAGFAAELSWAFYGVMALAALEVVYQLSVWKPADPANCLNRFKNNRDFGLLVFVAITVGKLV